MSLKKVKKTMESSLQSFAKGLRKTVKPMKKDYGEGLIRAKKMKSGPDESILRYKLRQPKKRR
jgi:hypothetical protein